MLQSLPISWGTYCTCMYSQAPLNLMQTENTVSTLQAKRFQTCTEIIVYSQHVYSVQAQWHWQREKKVPGRSSCLVFPERVTQRAFLLLEAQWARSVVLVGCCVSLNSQVETSCLVLLCWCDRELLSSVLCLGTGRRKNCFALVDLVCAACETEVEYALSWAGYLFCSGLSEISPATWTSKEVY